MTSIAPASDTELNTGSLSSNISNQPQDTNPASQSSKNATETDESTSLPSASRDEYPEQRHAGAVGYGPSYNKDAGIGEKITGIKEEVLGKIKKDPSLVEQGKLRKTGELQKREAAAHETDPFASPEDKAAEDAPEDTNADAGRNQEPNVEDIVE